MVERYSEKINEIIEKHIPLLNALSPAEMGLKPRPEKWSKKEILGHLIDSAYNNHKRFLTAEKKEDLVFDGYDQDEWVFKNNYQNRDEKEIIGLFISAYRHIAHLIGSINDVELNKVTTVHNFDKICMNTLEEGEPTTLSYLIEDYIFHLEHHLGQVV